MAVRCSHCGEELLGAVNRCWKCGRAFAAQPTLDGLPPVRCVPLADEVPEVAVAVVAQEPQEADASHLTIDGSLGLRRGSPFANSSPLRPAEGRVLPLSLLPLAKVTTPVRPNSVAIGGAIGGIVLGVFALVLAPFRAEAAIVAVIGLAMGIWGLFSPRRGWALVGLLFCCLAIGWASYTGARMINSVLNRNKAWETDDVEMEDVTP